jgi:hypothetical protein
MIAMFTRLRRWNALRRYRAAVLRHALISPVLLDLDTVLGELSRDDQNRIIGYLTAVHRHVGPKPERYGLTDADVARITGGSNA